MTANTDTATAPLLLTQGLDVAIAGRRLKRFFSMRSSKKRMTGLETPSPSTALSRVFLSATLTRGWRNSVMAAANVRDALRSSAPTFSSSLRPAALW